MNLIPDLKNIERPKGQKIKNAEKPLHLLQNVAFENKIEAVFELFNPSASQVFVAGSFNNWQSKEIALTNCGGGEWSVALMLSPGRYEYRFIIDGEWTSDPNAASQVPNGCGGFNSVIEV